MKALRSSQNSDLIPVDKEVSFQQQHLTENEGNDPKVWLCGHTFVFHMETSIPEKQFIPMFRQLIVTLLATCFSGPTSWTTRFQPFHVCTTIRHIRAFFNIQCPEWAWITCICYSCMYCACTLVNPTQIAKLHLHFIIIWFLKRLTTDGLLSLPISPSQVAEETCPSTFNVSF